MSWSSWLGLPPGLDWTGRCFACGGENGVGAEQCVWCGIHLAPDWEGEQDRHGAALSSWLEPGEVRAPPQEWWPDDIVLRQLATARRLRFEPAMAGTFGGHGSQPACGTLHEAPAAPPPPVSVVILSRPDDPRLMGVIDHALTFSDDIIAMLDTEERDVPPSRQCVTFLTRPLQGDFAAQRNAAQAACRHPWVFHLDTDEQLSSMAAAQFSLAVSLAERDGLDAIGFPRRNIVDGRLSSHYPDVQYRMVRRTVPFEGEVHEVPTACADWTRTMIAFGPGLEHHLSAWHVETRRQRYDALGQDDERRREAEALSIPWRG